MKRCTLAAASGWAALTLSLSANAAEVRYELDSEDELVADGWSHNGDAPITFADGQMMVATSSYNEWILYNDAASPARWWNYVNDAKGWWVEMSLQLITGPDSASCFDGGPGIWIHDGTNLIKFTLTETEARISYPMLSPVAVDPTDDFHTYRVQNLGGSHIQVLVDGMVQLDLTLTNQGGGTEGITIGDLGGCGGSTAVWEYLAYDTAAPGTEADDNDGDGIEAAVDLCPSDADLEQLDTDSDRLGDACDACPNDRANDYDEDGLCADEDICPNSADNTDADANGICDSEECLAGGGAYPLPAARVAPCLTPEMCCAYGFPPPPVDNAGGTGGMTGTAGAVAGMDPSTDPEGMGGAAGQSTNPDDSDDVDAGSSSSDPNIMSNGQANANSRGSCSLSRGGQGSQLPFGLLALAVLASLVRRGRSAYARRRA